MSTKPESSAEGARRPAEEIQEIQVITEQPPSPTTEETPLLTTTRPRRRRFSLMDTTKPLTQAYKKVREEYASTIEAARSLAAVERTGNPLPPAAEGAARRRPSIVEFVGILARKIAHPLTTPVRPPDAVFLAQAYALRDVVNFVIADFQKNNIRVDRHSIIDTMRRIIPAPANWPVVRNQILGQSWKTPDDVLAAAFGLANAMGANYRISEGTVVFYVRSRRVGITNLQLLIDLFEKRYHHPEFVSKMDNLIDEAESSGHTIVVPKYIGTAKSPTTPFDRFQQDLEPGRATLFGKINLCIDQLKIDGSWMEEGEEGEKGEAWRVKEFVPSNIHGRYRGIPGYVHGESIDCSVRLRVLDKRSARRVLCFLRTQ